MNKNIWFYCGFLALCVGDVAGQEKVFPSIKVKDHNVYISWKSREREKYKILYRDTLGAHTDWQELITVRSGGLITVVNQEISQKERYYAVLPIETVKWGASAGWKESDLFVFEKQVSIPTDHFATFVHWGNESSFPSYLKSYMKMQDKTLIIFWEAMDYNVASIGQPRFNYDAVLRGDWDNYFRSFFKSAKEYDGPVVLIPYSEMNGNWTPWSGTLKGNTAVKHISAYRYIREFGRSATNVAFGWAANAISVPNVIGNQIKDYYPGDDYVDVVGLDGFNFGNPWLTFGQIFDSGLTVLESYNKPIYIFSFACGADPRKASWIKDALTVQIPKHKEIKGWVWFNENKERDWRINSDTNSLEEFREAVLER